MSSLRWTVAFGAAVIAGAIAAACGSGSPNNFGSGGKDASTGSDAPSDVATQPEAGGDSPSLGDGGLPTGHDDFPNPIIDSNAPPNAATLFQATDQGTDGPCVYEPEMGALFPNNWMRLRFRYNTTHQENLYELRLTIPNEKDPLVIYTASSS